MPQLLLDQELANALASYLMERPYKEVAHLIQRLASIRPAPESKPEPKVNGPIPEVALKSKSKKVSLPNS